MGGTLHTSKPNVLGGLARIRRDLARNSGGKSGDSGTRFFYATFSFSLHRKHFQNQERADYQAAPVAPNSEHQSLGDDLLSVLIAGNFVRTFNRRGDDRQ